jgi:2-oxo-3-hexenedioate decarboxylase/2-keto-4-pentenoate hydratase
VQTSAIYKAAQTLLDWRLSLTSITELPEAFRPRDEAEGYAVQQAYNALLGEAGLGRSVGYKVGCTTPVMQASLGIANPCSGVILEKAVLRHGGSIPLNGFLNLGVECEFAVELRSDLRPNGSQFTRASVAKAVGAVMVAIEIVDNRYADHRTLGIPTLIADNFFDCGCVLGEPVRDWRALDLPGLWGTISINGDEVRRGQGEAVMGHPFEALAWLANSRSKNGLQPLRAGEFALLGSIVKTKRLHAGDKARVAIESLGQLQLNVD